MYIIFATGQPGKTVDLYVTVHEGEKYNKKEMVVSLNINIYFLYRFNLTYMICEMLTIHTKDSNSTSQFKEFHVIKCTPFILNENQKALAINLVLTRFSHNNSFKFSTTKMFLAYFSLFII